MLQDVASTTASKGGFCVKHNMVCSCTLPENGLALYCAGFVCKSNSVLRPDRFTTDPTSLEAESEKTFHLTVRSIRANKPAHFILENVQGARRDYPKPYQTLKPKG